MNRNNVRLLEEKKDIRIEIVELCFVVLDDRKRNFYRLINYFKK